MHTYIGILIDSSSCGLTARILCKETAEAVWQLAEAQALRKDAENKFEHSEARIGKQGKSRVTNSENKEDKQDNVGGDWPKIRGDLGKQIRNPKPEKEDHVW